MFNSKIFNDKKITDATKIVFVADLYVEDYVGGAELTTQSLIDECPFEYVKLKSSEVNIENLKNGHHCHWVFGNFAQLNPELIPSIVGNINYSVLEYDYKFCRFRSPEKHQNISGSPCDCHNQMNGKIISAFYYGAQSIWWMSERQKEKYLEMFPFLKEKDNVVISSIFDKKTLGTINFLRNQSINHPKSGWVVLGSQSWVKGFEAAKEWCETNKKEYEIVWNLPYENLLTKLSTAEGFVYLPSGADTCPRMVIEAKLLGCKLHINEYVQHANESWFNTDDLQSITDYLYASPGLFWNSIKNIMEYIPKISGYTTTYNCITGEYPFEDCIKSMEKFCYEICVVDGGSTDGTYEKLLELSKIYDKIKVKQVIKDFSDKRFAPQVDGLLKAEARKMCSGDFCWQMDSDEIVGEGYEKKIIDIASKISKEVEVISLPVVEFWGGPEKVRIDITPWKWRLSRNSKNITHGIPTELRRYDSEGKLYAAPGTDSCDMIYEDSGERVPHLTFISKESETARIHAINGNKQALIEYESWFNNVITNLPTVYHYSWYSLERKIRHYKNYWSKFWNSMYGEDKPDTAENNVMFDVPWSEVTDDMIKEKASELKEGTGGWIFHKKWSGQKIPHITINKNNS